MSVYFTIHFRVLDTVRERVWAATPHVTTLPALALCMTRIRDRIRDRARDRVDRRVEEEGQW